MTMRSNREWLHFMQLVPSALGGELLLILPSVRKHVRLVWESALVVFQSAHGTRTYRHGEVRRACCLSLSHRLPPNR